MGLPAVFALGGVERAYAWGSTTALPRLLGREPDGRPLAELWFGAHPDGPAGVPALGTTLDALIAADPAGVLGAATAERFGGALPFLVKLLAAERPLSIQVHPTRAQAEAGFAAEDARGVPRDAPQRNYRDRNHKPELLVALSEFDALCGFRPIDDTLRLLDAFDLTELEPVRELLHGPDPLRTAVTYLLRLPEPGPLVTAVAARAESIGEPDWSGAAGAVRQAAADFPGDVGIVLTLLLNQLRLRPGDAIFLGAGTVHAYLRGVGVEVMAASDNVLRCGLTAKHVDVGELLEITDFAELADPRAPEHHGSFQPPVPDFEVRPVDLDAHREPDQAAGECALGLGGRPGVVVCTAGRVRVAARAAAVELTPGHAAFVTAESAPPWPGCTLRGTGQVFVATVPPA